MRLSRLLVLLLLPAGLGLAQTRVHVVRAGDSIAKLMWTYGVSGEAILQANGLSSPQLAPGTRLVIPAASSPASPASPAAPENPPPIPVAPAVPAPATGTRNFEDAIRIPARESVRYNGRWVPPGETSAWVMDCSNTTRWLYREVRGIELPRTASDQYEWLRTRHRLWRTRGDSRSLRKRLRPGDLLFWENTYKPARKPPVTHVMVYLGTDARGRLMMAGSQGASGPDIYEFKPGQKMGGYRFFFFFRRDGRFVAYGRP